MKNKFSTLIAILIRYKFLFTLLFFIVWIFAIDNNNYFYRAKMKKKISELNVQKTYYKDKIHEDSIRLFELKTNDDVLEEFAREKYLMKKKNEDLIIVVEKTN